VVILWPYLGHFFQMLDMLDNGRFRSAVEQQRGVHLLEYLVSGRIDAPEEQLLLPKLLCGLDGTDVLEAAGPLSERERDAAAGLLAAVIAHWQRLGNTSADGLRETFLRRPARLRRKDADWQLDVPARPFDVLMSGLPWALSMIRLPWMKGVLWVHWK
jgi:hypothetical protein